MHYYLIDPNQYDGKNFEFYQTKLFSLLGEYQIAGETARVTRLRSVKDLAGTAIGHGAKTLVVVGGDDTLIEVMTYCLGKDVTLGFIPLNSSSEVGPILGDYDLGSSVATLAKRRVEELDVINVNGKHVFSNIVFGPFAAQTSAVGKSLGLTSLWRIESEKVEVRIDDSFKATVPLIAGAVINCRDTRFCDPKKSNVPIGDPRDGRMEVVLAPNLSKYQMWRHRKEIQNNCYENLPGVTVMRAKKVELSAPEGMEVYLSRKKVTKLPVVVEMLPEKVRMVVGRYRQF